MSINAASALRDAFHPNTASWILMIMLSSVGSRLIVEEVNDSCPEAMDNWAVKVLILFSILHLSTKEVVTPALWTIVLVVLWNWFKNGPGKNYCKRARDGKHSWSLT